MKIYFYSKLDISQQVLIIDKKHLLVLKIQIKFNNTLALVCSYSLKTHIHDFQ